MRKDTNIQNILKYFANKVKFLVFILDPVLQGKRGTFSTFFLF